MLVVVVLVVWVVCGLLLSVPLVLAVRVVAGAVAVVAAAAGAYPPVRHPQARFVGVPWRVPLTWLVTFRPVDSAGTGTGQLRRQVRSPVVAACGLAAVVGGLCVVVAPVVLVPLLPSVVVVAAVVICGVWGELCLGGGRSG